MSDIGNALTGGRNGNTSFRVVVLDIDGTIVGSDLVLSERLRSAVASAQAAGATVLIATGRILGSALGFSRELKTNGPLVCFQGAITADPITGDVVRHARMDASLAAEALDLLNGASGQLSMVLDNEIYVEERSEWAVGYAQRMDQALNVVDSLKVVSVGEPTLILSVDEPGPTGIRADHLTAHFGDRARITHSLPHFCEVASPDAGKLNALEIVLDGLGATPEEVVAFGDGVGDAEMLGWAGLGIAVGDAHPIARERADTLIAGPDADGVAQAVEELLNRNLLSG
ncbi:MAG: HAD family phosphatase [Chloroflexi bacterium]|nr:HAD family phosphatase [Chloroflexota bacterium]MBT4515500.1 HAD family phosphatase [Chloroflexota bacterium]MBT6682764.1 HAD family phosphatase [Chloroflexota bacterium]